MGQGCRIFGANKIRVVKYSSNGPFKYGVETYNYNSNPTLDPNY